ncbi:MAG: hypothetical protein EPN69_10285 [Rhodanobacter sp.]|nr:MAG: hypothetical protein EPN71_12660 [Rhodanobacter sp.]TAL91466.1 MAG: hypothetical protein EPN69_10285 [Rhodanobacter sp.]TAM42169.1 MAG: hypothetical protein EPN58_04060 [Rhodanobacter sp.]TAN26770.1 MAG: hypothetical protein EPN32_05930 [Rhodanobacter sp.]
MRRPFRMHRTTRRRLIWLVMLLMLWQQAALAAYACPTVPDATPAAAVMNSMPSMGDSFADMQNASASPLCQKLCLPDRATQVDARTASVPLSTLAAVPPMLASVTVVALQSDRSIQRVGHLRTLLPPPMLLFCALLI